MLLIAVSCKFVHKRTMTEARSRRHKALADLLRRRAMSRQDALVAELRALGFDVTQATVSRDLDQLGAVKIRRGGTTSYALPERLSAPAVAADRLPRLFAEWVREIVPAASLIVLRTPPGSAHLLGVALDAAELPDIAGTISGDDTVFVATASAEVAAALAAEWKDMLGT